ncbi:MAG TPA: serine/threonine-protein kinase, partial [Polyangiaceae bacterium]
MTRRKASSSTQASAIDSLHETPRLPARRRAAGARRVRKGEFQSGALVPGTRYRVVGLLGAGGMGLVYDVEHVELGKRFVLKALLSDLAARDDIVARLRNEQRALGRLQHPNIIAVTDAGMTSENIPFFVMERLEGETLGARLKRSRTLPIVEALGVARGVLDGLSAAHEIGVVHRDIKPQNIFLSSGSRPKILDFGVAKVADAASVITARGVALGTPRYM